MTGDHYRIQLAYRTSLGLVNQPSGQHNQATTERSSRCNLQNSGTAGSEYSLSSQPSSLLTPVHGTPQIVGNSTSLGQTSITFSKLSSCDGSVWHCAQDLLYNPACLLHSTSYSAEMWGWFGGAGAQKRKDAPKNAILMLRQQLDMLQKRERHLKSQRDDQEALARKNLSTNKTGKDTAFRA